MLFLLVCFFFSYILATCQRRMFLPLCPVDTVVFSLAVLLTCTLSQINLIDWLINQPNWFARNFLSNVFAHRCLHAITSTNKKKGKCTKIRGIVRHWYCAHDLKRLTPVLYWWSIPPLTVDRLDKNHYGVTILAWTISFLTISGSFDRSANGSLSVSLAPRRNSVMSRLGT